MLKGISSRDGRAYVLRMVCGKQLRVRKVLLGVLGGFGDLR
jgi:hypothetical protein